MATKGKKIVTDLVGKEIEFDSMPNEKLANQRGMIVSVRARDKSVGCGYAA